VGWGLGRDAYKRPQKSKYATYATPPGSTLVKGERDFHV